MSLCGTKSKACVLHHRDVRTGSEDSEFASGKNVNTGILFSPVCAEVVDVTFFILNVAALKSVGPLFKGK